MLKRITLALTLVLAGSLLGLISLTPVVSNLWNVATGRGFFIPQESNIFTFEVTQSNDGSGEWWLYGKDSQRFYAYGFDGHGDSYAEIERAVNSPNFNSQNFETWPADLIHFHTK